MAQLGVNVDHVATLRQARRTYEPDPVLAAHEAILGGATGITVHLREDRRHIQDRDLRLLRQILDGHPVKLNLELALSAEVMAIAEDVHPDQVTFVPEKRQEVTTEGGLCATDLKAPLREALSRFAAAGVTTSLFIDPQAEQIAAAVELGADAVEFHTGAYAQARSPAEIERHLAALSDGLCQARTAGLSVHAGHGLNYHNVRALAALDGFEEFNIGHAIVARAIYVGLREAVREMVALCLGSAPTARR